VLKHGGRVPTTVVVGYGVHDVELEIADEGMAMRSSPRASAIGHGLVGMRERVTMLGGHRAMTIRVLIADDQALTGTGPIRQSPVSAHSLRRRAPGDEYRVTASATLPPGEAKPAARS
jgi:glucose-6-phosphate-specific signal transduction histidine kinase